MKRVRSLAPAAAVCVLTLCAAPAGAQQPQKLAATAIHVDTGPVLDGSLDDAAWQGAQALGGFTQSEPIEGQPASQTTEVRIVFDDEAVYVGIVCHDSDPSQIVTTDTRRDAGMNGQDSVQIIFDTFHDQQNGFVFGTNVAGTQFDGQVRDQGDANSNWDGSWDVKTNQTETGWTAEFRIPLRTLRYGPAPQTWGVNVTRNIQRTRERTYWAPLARIYDLGRLTSAGDLRGLDLETPRNFKLLPYGLGSANRNFTPGADVDLDADWGGDAKIGVTPSLNLDLSYNTDFAQVEVDSQQINLSRFNLRFPEKRPFFLENSGLFKVGKGQDLDLFFSRRIGLDDNGGIVPIIAGGRLSGKASGFNVGVLDMVTESVDGKVSANNFSVFRMSREMPQRSGLGFILVNRQGVGDHAGSDNWNRTWGADARLGVGEHTNFAGFVARTETPGIAGGDESGREYAYNVDSVFDNGRHTLQGEYGVTGESFNPEVGFLNKNGGYRRMFGRVAETFRGEKVRSWGFRQIFPHMTVTRYDYLDGGLNNMEFHLDNDFDWENGTLIATPVNGTWEGLREPFEVYPGVVVPPGEHGGFRFSPMLNTDRRKAVSGRVNADFGAFLTGHQKSFNVSLTLRQGGRFSVDSSWNRRDIDLPEGAFITNLGNMRVTFNFTTQVFVQSLIQYNDRSRRWSTNLRFHMLETAGTGLFVVYNDTEALDGLGPVNRAFIVKYVRQFDILR